MPQSEGESFRVAVLGAGMSGICMGIKLKQAGIDDFVILEKANAVGGTWRENTYPGIACDVPSHVYSFSFELNPDWTHSFSSGAEIWDYCRHCVEKYHLEPHLRFNSEVDSANFVDGRWHVTTKHGRHIVADVLVSGLGGLHCPKHVDIAGLADFAGIRFHTAEWNHRHDLTDRHVAIIGTGASAAQVLPNIASQVAEVTVFQRSAAWVFPRLASDIPESRRASFRKRPWLMRAYRWWLWLLLDVVGVRSLRRDSWANRRLAKVADDFLARSVTDPDTRAKLTPHYTAGCKRRVIADDYLETFNRANVHLVTDPIARIEADGVRDATGALHRVDTIIEATGFKPFDITDYVDIRGRDGRSLRQAFADRVESFRTVMVPDFPNFFLLLGPNSATGHTSALIMIESQADFVVNCMQLMDKHGIARLDPTPEATMRFNRRIQRDMKKMVFSGGCGSWYTDDNDVNFTLWPYSALRFLMELHRPRRDEFAADPRVASTSPS
jgi:cation diffusion facilitator CzcD-associated flavoprotein CzcO